MSLYIKDVYSKNFRNFKEHYLPLRKGIIFLVGNNAVEKTNTLEALYLITTTKSMRGSLNKEIIKDGYEEAHVKGLLVGDDREINIGASVLPSNNTFFSNDKKCKKALLVSLLPVVVFISDDLLVVKGSKA